VIEINPNALYTRADLAAMLAPAGVDVDRFVARLRPRKVFRAFWKGSDLIEAYDKAPALAEQAEAPIPAAQNGGNRRRRGAHVVTAPGAKLDAYMAELRTQP